MGVTYPLFVFEKDDKSMRLIHDEAAILYHLEAIDIENEEYVFWDANGAGVSVQLSNNNVTTVKSSAVDLPLAEALASYASSLGVFLPDQAESPMEVWSRIQAEPVKRPKKGGFFSRW